MENRSFTLRDTPMQIMEFEVKCSQADAEVDTKITRLHNVMFIYIIDAVGKHPRRESEATWLKNKRLKRKQCILPYEKKKKKQFPL